MDHPNILIADADPKNLQILRDSLLSAGFSVNTATDGLEAWEKIHVDPPDIILSEVSLPSLDGFQLLEKLKADPAMSNIPIMFLTNRREIQDRVRSLRGGVKDYMIKPLHVKEVIARIRMILRRIERMKAEESDATKKLVGRLEEYSVVELIESFGVERKSGVLTVYNENNRNGEIYFKNGAVIHAQLGTLKAEKAVYQMLPWRRGHFIMSFKDVQVADTVSVSNLGLLLHGFKRMEERKKYFKALPSPETTFVLSDSFRKILAKKELAPDVAKFISLIDGRRDIMQIIDESTYDDLRTLEKLAKLYQQGFIKPGKPSDHKPAEIKVAETPPARQKALDQTAAPQQRNAAQPQQPDAPVFTEDVPISEKVSDDSKLNEPVQDSSGDEAAPTISETESSPAASATDATPVEGRHEKKAETGKPARIDERPDDILDRTEGEDRILRPSVEVPDETVPEEPQPVRKKVPGLPAPVDPACAVEESVAESESNGNVRETPEFTSVPPPFGASIFRPDLDILEALVRFRTKEIPAVPDAEDFPLRPYGPGKGPEPPKGKGEEIQEKPEPEPASVAPAEHLEPASNAKEAQSDAVAMQEKELSPPPAEARAPELDAPQPAEARAPELDAPQPVKKQHVAKLPSRRLPRFDEAADPFTDIEHIAGKKVEPEEGAAAEEKVTDQTKPEIAEKLANMLGKIAERAVAPPAKLVLIGNEVSHIEKYAQFLLAGEPVKRLQNKNFEFLGMKQRKTSTDKDIVIIGVSMEQQFTQLLDSLADGFAGYLILIEGSVREELQYISYLHSALKEKYKKPFALAVVNSRGRKGFSGSTVRELIQAEPEDLILDLDLDDTSSMLAFLESALDDRNLYRWDEDK